MNYSCFRDETLPGVLGDQGSLPKWYIKVDLIYFPYIAMADIEIVRITYG